MLFNVDKLSLTLYNNELNINHLETNLFTFTKINDVRSMHTDTYIIHHVITKKEIGILLFSNKANKTHTLHVNNKQFYTIGWIELLIDLHEILNCSYKISRMDIALDSNTNYVKRFEIGANAIKSGYTNKKYINETHYYGKYFDRIDNSNYKAFETIYISNSTKSRALRFYQKSNEINHSHKDYISTFYAQFHTDKIDVTQPYFRAEISLKGSVFELKNTKYRLIGSNDLYRLVNDNDVNQIYKSEISKQTFSKLNKQDKEKYEAIEVMSYYNIDIFQLENQNYLESIFVTFQPFNNMIINKLYKIKNTENKVMKPEKIHRNIILLDSTRNKKQPRITDEEIQLNIMTKLLNILDRIGSDSIDDITLSRLQKYL